MHSAIVIHQIAQDLIRFSDWFDQCLAILEHQISFDEELDLIRVAKDEKDDHIPSFEVRQYTCSSATQNRGLRRLNCFSAIWSHGCIVRSL